MWRARNGFTLLSLIIALCSAATAQPGVTPEHRPTPGDSDEQRIADLVVASRILVQEGVLDSFGHVTVRSLKNPNHYFMPRAMPPALVTANDIVELDVDSVPIDANAPRTNGERFIHGEIYRVRPDVQAVVHSHSPAWIPFSISPDRPLRQVLHMAGFLPGRVSVFDHRDVSRDDTARQADGQQCQARRCAGEDIGKRFRRSYPRTWQCRGWSLCAMGGVEGGLYAAERTGADGSNRAWRSGDLSQ